MSKRKYLYDQHQLDQAVSAVKQNRLTISKAAREYNVPRKTVDDRVKGRSTPGSRPGPKQLISADHEAILVDYFTYMATHGWPYCRRKAKALIRQMAILQGNEHRLGRTGPTDTWFRAFLARNPGMSEKKARLRDHKRFAQSNELVINRWFDLLEGLINKLGLQDHPERIWNADETGFCGKDHPRQKVLCAKGLQPFQVKLTSDDHVTANVCVSASGSVMPTMIIYKGGFPHQDYKLNVPKEWVFALSDSGYMDTHLFTQWFCDVFVPNCGRKRPVLLIVDNHESHINLAVIEKAREEKIEILGLPGNTTHLLQPLDVALFNILKGKFIDLAQTMNLMHSNNIISRAKLPMLLKYSVKETLTEKNIKSAFLKSGIMPMNRKNIDWTQVQKSRKKVPEESSSTSTTLDLNETSSSNPPSPCTCSCHNCTQCTCRSASGSSSGTHCNSCFQVLPGRHPVNSVLNLPEELQRLCHVPGTKSSDSKTGKFKVSVVGDGRHMTGDEMNEQVRLKVEKKTEMEKRKQERLAKRAEAQKAKEEKEREKESRKTQNSKKVSPKGGKRRSKRVCRTSVRLSQSRYPPKVSSDSDSEDGVAHKYDFCFKCGLKDCENGDLDWVECDGCGHIFHASCVHGSPESKFMCDVCQKATDEADECCKECGLSEPDGEDQDIEWISCDLCDCWFHNICVGLRPGAKTFVCQSCC